MWAFWSVKEAGGVQKYPVRDSGLWMLKFENLVEVSEAHTLASGGFGTDIGQNEKILGKNSEIVSFCPKKCHIPQKNPH